MEARRIAVNLRSYRLVLEFYGRAALRAADLYMLGFTRGVYAGRCVLLGIDRVKRRSFVRFRENYDPLSGGFSRARSRKTSR
jgi:hypothetical protein